MSIPSPRVMARYRATSLSSAQRVSSEMGSRELATSSESGRVSSADVDTPTQRVRRPDSFAFSNDDRSSNSVLRSFGRVSLNRRPEGIDD